jgi:serine/threonine-protein kinase
MTSHRDPEADPTPEEERLATLLLSYESRRDVDSAIGVGQFRDDAGELFDDLVGLAECLSLVKTGLADEDEGKAVPAAIGKYRVLSRLGVGVSGVVYSAEVPESGEHVAIKVMKDSIALSENAVERFRREIVVAGKLRDPHIVRVLDDGELGRCPYYVMELMEGRSLGDLLDEIELDCDPAPGECWMTKLDLCGVPPASGRPSSVADAYARRIAALFAPVARALAVASEAGLVHRDLKPDNILLRADGRAVVTDFGLAKLVGDDITATMAVLGTPAYMSPEQAAGRSKRVDARSDIYGLGATMHHALTGSGPVKADSFPELLAAILTERPPPVLAFCPKYSTGISQVVERCLEKEPSARYPDGDTLSEDLYRVARGKSPRLGEVPWTKKLFDPGRKKEK